ncbi:hypothetical protein CGRA01v4_06446 [Colletotrichum graminicola]|nr:hypothetical protein CGRA01v4_06446 [Colletotrichum graminicola]
MNTRIGQIAHQILFRLPRAHNEHWTTGIFFDS